MKTVCVLIILYVVFLPSLFAQTVPSFLKDDGSSAGYSKTLSLTPLTFDIRKIDLFKRWFNNRKVEKQSEVGDKQRLREEWQEFLGIDVFAPYFKAKEVEKYVQEKTKVEFFNFRGRAEFEEGKSSVRYIFKKKF